MKSIKTKRKRKGTVLEKKKKQKKKLSRYEEIARNEHLKMQSDLIYRLLMSKDTTELDNILKTFRSQTLQSYKNISEMFRVQTNKTINGKEHYARIAKHGLFFFYLWMNPAYAESLCSSPSPVVDPVKFERFYKEKLPKSCQELLQTRITTLQAFVEKVRTDYFTL